MRRKGRILRTSQTFEGSEKHCTFDVIISTGAFVAREEIDDRGNPATVELGLDMNPEAIDLTRLTGGVAPVLNNHHDGSSGERMSANHQMGIVEHAWIERNEETGTNVLMGRLRLSRVTQEEREICEKIEAGIIRSVSVGADILERQEIDASEKGHRRELATSWAPYEVSIVAIPADCGSIIRKATSTNRVPLKDKVRLVHFVNPQGKFTMAKDDTTKEEDKEKSSKFAKLETWEKLYSGLSEDERTAFMAFVETRELAPPPAAPAAAPAEDGEDMEPTVTADEVKAAAQEAGAVADDVLPDDVSVDVENDVMMAVEEILAETLAGEMEGAEPAAAAPPEDPMMAASKKGTAKAMQRFKTNFRNKLYTKLSSPKIQRRTTGVTVDNSYRENNLKTLRNKAEHALISKITRGRGNSHAKHAELAGNWQFKPISEICRELLSHAGHREVRNLTGDEIWGAMKRAPRKERRGAAGPIMAYADLPELIASSATKAVIASYEQFRGEQTFDPFVTRLQVADFKVQDRVGISDTGDLVETAPGAAFPIDSLDDTKETYALMTSGLIHQITRQTFVTDDTNSLQAIFNSGKSAADLESDLVWNQVINGTYQGATLYSNARGTLSTGVPFRTNPTQVMPQYDYAGVEAMMVAFGLRRTPKNAYMNLKLQYILVPLQLEFEALQAVNSSYTPNAPQTANVMFGGLKVIAEPRLSTNSATSYYGVADKAGSGYPFIELATLQGQKGPRLEEELDFNTDVMKFKVVHDVQAKSMDYRLAHKCTV